LIAIVEVRRDDLGDLGMIVRIIFKSILKKVIWQRKE